MTPFGVHIITPTGVFWQGDVVCLTVPLSDGAMQFLAHHAEELAVLTDGIIYLGMADGTKVPVRTAGGMVYCDGRECHVYGELITYPQDWDETCERRAAFLTQELQRRKQSLLEHKLSSVALNKAFVEMHHPLKDNVDN